MNTFLFGLKEEIGTRVTVVNKFISIKQLIFECIKNGSIVLFVSQKYEIVECGIIDQQYFSGRSYAYGQIIKIIPFEEWYEVYKKLSVIS